MKREKDRLYIGAVVRHFKWELLSEAEKQTGKYTYVIRERAVHTETGEDLVIYQALYPNEAGKYVVYARPYNMFIEEVDRVKYPDIKQKYRFEVVN